MYIKFLKKIYKNEEAYNIFKNGLQSYVDILTGYGKKVFILSDNPTLPTQQRNYVHRPFKLKTSKFPEVYVSNVKKIQAPYLNILSEIRNATIIDTIGPMCPDGNCMVFTKDGLPMYWDNNHLSYAGSEFQAEYILKPYLIGSKSE
jgi:hypothetical protein